MEKNKILGFATAYIVSLALITFCSWYGSRSEYLFEQIYPNYHAMNFKETFLFSLTFASIIYGGIASLALIAKYLFKRRGC